MGEKSIIMQPESVLGILDDRKTMTRRVLKPQPCEWVESVDYNSYQGRWEFTGDEGGMMSHAASFPGQPPLKCPYGSAGDELWVRETHCYLNDWDRCKPSNVEESALVKYLADNSMSEKSPIYTPDCGRWGRVRQSIFMPRWASRLQLLIKDVRVERLQNITEEDAMAEGVMSAPFTKAGRKPHLLHVETFEHLWDSINAKRGHSWESNPFLWVIEFELQK